MLTCTFAPFKDLHRVILQQDPEAVDAEGGAERDVQKVERAHDERKNAGPLLALEEADARDEPGNRQHDEEHADADSEDTEYRHGLRVVRQAPDRRQRYHDDDAHDESKNVIGDEERPQQRDMFLHPHFVPLSSE